jgi:gliding motility-associated-like protein
MDAITSYPVDSFAWSFIPNSGCINCPDPMLAPFSTSTYTVTVTDENGCTATDNIQIFVEKPREVFIPNVFSPNNDGQNDIFMIFAGDDVQKVNSFIVFNRWGETMFEVYNFQPNSPAYGWNGTHRSRKMNTGVYVFLAEVEFIDGEVVMFKGDVTLVR